MTAPSPIVVMAADELAVLIRNAAADAVAEAIGDLMTLARPTLSPTTYYSVPEFAALLKVGTDCIYKACASGQLPHLKAGTSIRIPETALAEFQQGGQS